MQISIRHSSNGAYADGKAMVVDRRYPIGDEEGHDVILRPSGRLATVFQVKRGKRTTETITVPSVSGITGRYPSGDPAPHDVEFCIVPGQPSFPRGDVIRNLIGRGVSPANIHLLNDGETLHEIIATTASPVMVCNNGARVEAENRDDHPDLLPHVAFTARPPARWAIRTGKTPGSVSVYLWPGVVDDTDALFQQLAA